MDPVVLDREAVVPEQEVVEQEVVDQEVAFPELEVVVLVGHTMADIRSSQHLLEQQLLKERWWPRDKQRLRKASQDNLTS